MTTENKPVRERLYEFTFMNADGSKMRIFRVMCREDNLGGVKEAIAMDLESKSADFWFCAGVREAVPESGGQVRMGENA